VPCSHNPLGVKGAGEAGATGAPAAVVTAVLDALAPLGVTSINMPATPEKVWRLIHWATGPLLSAIPAACPQANTPPAGCAPLGTICIPAGSSASDGGMRQPRNSSVESFALRPS
jgi:hypothetical protein